MILNCLHNIRGDWILLKVTNDLTDEGTTIHAHGLLQKETPWYDGVPGVSTCPLVPKGGYEELLFRADQYGTSWYHSMLFPPSDTSRLSLT